MDNPRVSDVFMTLALIGIIGLLFTADGCGTPYRRISGIAFSPDGKRLAVARHDARDSNTQGKFYLSNVSRTVSVLRVPNLQTEITIERDLRRGNRGPAFDLYKYTPKSLGFVGNSHTLGVVHFGGGVIVLYDIVSGTTSKLSVDEQLPPITMHVADAAGILVTGVYEDVVVLDADSGQKIQQFKSRYKPFSGIPLFAIADGNAVIATVEDDNNVLRLWSLVDAGIDYNN